MTAEHVIESLRREKPKISMSLLLGYGLVFGTVPIPDECFAQIESIEYFGIKKDDPLKIINGNINAMTPLDIAHLNAHILPQAPAQLHLGLNKLSWTPKVGDAVLAIGYPELECKLLKEQDQRQLLTEGMYGAFGIIREVHPQGTNSTHPTPVFEVEGIWPPGMSGGPVFNSNGEVIGIVSRSILPENDGPGIGFAACLYLLPVFK
jgi:serine protease Do